MSAYQDKIAELNKQPRRWLVTGVAGFIGSNLLETLLSHNQVVVGLDNFATGHRHNLEQVKEIVGDQRYRNFQFMEGDICDLACCREAAEGVDYVLHQAALGSVPRSIDDPIRTNASNVTGFLNMLVACRDAGVKSFTYAASSSTYGDHPALPKIEENIGNPLSPYAVTKYVNELYADVFSRCYEFNCIGLRYFNVFGPRQDPNGAYAAVIPKWIAALLEGRPVHINGKGDTSRDFCFIENAIQANILASQTWERSMDAVYNVAVGVQTDLLQLYRLICEEIKNHRPEVELRSPKYDDYRKGDVRHSLACISKIQKELGYLPAFDVARGMAITVDWFVRQACDNRAGLGAN